MSTNSNATLQNILTSVLSQANEEQSQVYSPAIYQAHFNIVTSFLITRCVELYPSNPEVIDILSPFVKVARIPITNGNIVLPDDYRNILGSPSIVVNGSKDGECTSRQEDITTVAQFQVATLKGGCTRRPIRIVPQSEFDYLSTSTYKAPDYWNPIGYFTSNKSIKVCPFDLTKVDLMFVRNEPLVKFGYIIQPDDTYIFDPNTSVESLWTNAAFVPLLKGVTALYSAYSRDNQMADYTKLLMETNLI